jgi:hypothetical protein
MAASREFNSPSGDGSLSSMSGSQVATPLLSPFGEVPRLLIIAPHNYDILISAVLKRAAKLSNLTTVKLNEGNSHQLKHSFAEARKVVLRVTLEEINKLEADNKILDEVILYTDFNLGYSSSDIFSAFALRKQIDKLTTNAGTPCVVVTTTQEYHAAKAEKKLPVKLFLKGGGGQEINLKTALETDPELYPEPMGFQEATTLTNYASLKNVSLYLDNLLSSAGIVSTPSVPRTPLASPSPVPRASLAAASPEHPILSQLMFRAIPSAAAVGSAVQTVEPADSTQAEMQMQPPLEEERQQCELSIFIKKAYLEFNSDEPADTEEELALENLEKKLIALNFAEKMNLDQGSSSSGVAHHRMFSQNRSLTIQIEQSHRAQHVAAMNLSPQK